MIAASGIGLELPTRPLKPCLWLIGSSIAGGIRPEKSNGSDNFPVEYDYEDNNFDSINKASAAAWAAVGELDDIVCFWIQL